MGGSSIGWNAHSCPSRRAHAWRKLRARSAGLQARREGPPSGPDELTEPAWGHAGRPAEGADEVREVSEADLVGDFRHPPRGICEQPGGPAEPRRHEVLVGSHSQDAAE